jgi:CheY-like chemotaxis protein
LYEAGLAAGLAWLARWMHEKHGLTVSVRLDERAATEREDVTVLLFQSVRELLFNVVKHADVNEASVTLARTDDDTLRITVSDRGKGFDSAASINAEDDDGAGFGLFSIRERLSLMGGKFEFRSVLGRGSQFVLVAPIHVSSEEPPTSLDIAMPAAGGVTKRRPLRGKARDNRIRILLVDDHDVMRQGLAALLASERQMKVIGEAADGLQAIEQARALQPDIVLMDFSMPRLDGVEATRRIKAEFPEIKIIALSIYEQFDRATAMIAAGASAYYTKSDNVDGLIQAILDHCGVKSTNGNSK